MSTRPLLGQHNPPSGPAEHARLAPHDSPLASQLPDWDLIPAHTMLVRRRTGATSQAGAVSVAVQVTPVPALSDWQTLVAPASEASASVPASTKDSGRTLIAPEPAKEGIGMCRQCGLQLEDGAQFCVSCGAKRD